MTNKTNHTSELRDIQTDLHIVLNGKDATDFTAEGELYIDSKDMGNNYALVDFKFNETFLMMNVTKSAGFIEAGFKRETIRKIYIYGNKDLTFTKVTVEGGKTYDVKKISFDD